MLVQFNDSNERYPCAISQVDDDVEVRFVGEFEASTEGFKCYTDNGKLIGAYDEYLHIKKAYSDGYLFTRDKPDEEIKPKSMGEKLAEAKEEISDLRKEIKELKEIVEELREEKDGN